MVKLFGISPTSTTYHDPAYTSSYDPLYKKPVRLSKEKEPNRTYEHLLGELHMTHALGTDIKDITYYGSRKLLGSKAEDIDVLILVDNVETTLSKLNSRYPDLYQIESSLSSRDPIAFTSTRLGDLNLMITASKERFEKTKRAQALVESLELKEKEERILMFSYVFDGPTKRFTDKDFTDVILKKRELKEFVKSPSYSFAASGSIGAGVPF